jgi:CelD/BcsL family acetyltransferase involved in cellulose biosynthesis
LTESDDITLWCDDFLKLEASGWKGRSGSALAIDEATNAFFCAALTGARAQSHLEMLRLSLDGRPIAMLVNFVTPPGSFSFKIAFDEDYARFSPGVLIQIENLAVLDRNEIAWMDSCAVSDHSMINSLWGERRSIVRVTVPLAGAKRRTIFAASRALEQTAALVRRAI